MAEPDFQLYFDILQTLERLQVPYVIIGAFAGTSYGVTRVTMDVDIVGKLMAWQEGRSFKHEVDIRDILTAIKLGDDTELSASFDPDYIDGWATRLGPNVIQFWVNLKKLVGLDEG